MIKGITSRSSVEIFCPAVPENFVEEPFNAVFQEISVSKKVYGKEEGEICYVIVPKLLVVESF